MSDSKFVMECGDTTLRLSERTHIMGIINCTPDSFYSGSQYFEPAQAIEKGVQMVEEGADILDIGGESTRPGADAVSESEELERVLPVIEGLRSRVPVPLSIDTFKSSVAERAIQAGVHILNDISALRFDDRIADVAARFNVPAILMHIKGTPKNMQRNPSYHDLMGELFDYFDERIEYATAHQISRDKIIIDPGIGFGKRLDDNYEILQNLQAFSKFGCPILVGPSRKSFIGRVLSLPPEESLEGTIAATTAAIMNGAHIVRVHDVRAIARAAKIADKLRIRTKKPE